MEYVAWREKNSRLQKDGTVYQCWAGKKFQNILNENGRTGMSLVAAVFCGIMVSPSDFWIYEYKNGQVDFSNVQTIAYKHNGILTRMEADIAPLDSGDFVRIVPKSELAPYLETAREELVFAAMMRKDGSVYAN